MVIWGDDIGGFNISAYNRGMMGYRTPNIDSLAAEPTSALAAKTATRGAGLQPGRHTARQG